MYVVANHIRAMIDAHPLVFRQRVTVATHFPAVAAALRVGEQVQREADTAARFIPTPNRSTQQ
jgi:hypothetical protein